MQNFLTYFSRIGPGIWTCVKAGEFEGPNGRIQVATGATFTMRSSFMGIDLANLLENEHCKKNAHAKLGSPPRYLMSSNPPLPAVV